jgi:hypothetical protein
LEKQRDQPGRASGQAPGYLVRMDRRGADESRAQYFLGLLCDSRVEIDRQIAKDTAAMTSYQSCGQFDGFRRLRRMIRVEERERQELDRMITALHRRSK